MRLSKIKLAGFKSFVDPTTIPLPSNLVGVVGPNGCGKSNVIDAVRWVMGESSAKHLRGDSMADVIFNGSNTRKPVGQASVELVFDNSDGMLGGQYAQYSEISTRRVVSRDGTSQYYLNGTRCRRRDITDIFLGTGLGPRSYSIIEQGMISRLIEAKPEDLRVFIEEAAGISKYKERRRETETRIRHTRDNMSRLNDLRDELEKQLEKLKQQSRTAEKYKELKSEERLVEAELTALRWRILDEQHGAQLSRISETETAYQAKIAEQRNIEAEIERQREQSIAASDAFNAVQGNYYAIGADIARVEQSIQHLKDRRQEQEQDLRDADRVWRETQTHLDNDQHRIAAIETQLQAQQPSLQQARDAEQVSARALSSAEDAMQVWQSGWDDFNQQAAEQTQQAQVERTRIQHLEQQLLQAQQRMQRLEEEAQRLNEQDQTRELHQRSASVEELQTRQTAVQTSLQALQGRIAEIRDAGHGLSAQLDDRRSRLQAAKGRFSSLEALQQAALGKTSAAVMDWLNQQGLGGNTRLAENLDVEAGWERAVECVLGQHLEAVCSHHLDSITNALEHLQQGSLAVFDTAAPVNRSSSSGVSAMLRDKVRAPWSLDSLLGGVHAAETLADALTLRGRLGLQESVITRDGVWLGQGWLRVVRGSDEHSGVIRREHELKTLAQGIQALSSEIDELQQHEQDNRAALRREEQTREQVQEELQQIGRQLTDHQSRLSGLQARQDQMRTRRDAVTAELAELRAQHHDHGAAIATARSQLETATNRMSDLHARREQLSAQRDQLRTALEASRTQAAEDRAHVHEIALRVESLTTELASTRQGLQRMETQLTQTRARREELHKFLTDSAAPLRELHGELETQLKRRVESETELTAARQRVDAIEHDLRELNVRRNATEQQAQDIRAQLDQLRLAQQELKVRRQTLLERIEESGHELNAVLTALPQESNAELWQERLEKLGARIQRLGPINLAAIDEYQQQQERKEYLDAQHTDLTVALETLENAIRKIDRETRTRFKETFDKINDGLKNNFPRLFGGGHAYLELTGEDLLDTGVSVMARPPGKRNSSIHLLSGGEKALTAVALVFSIFNLNPAPFCMLDEVDAPLDDANVGRFCDMVKEMSQRVQFIFITHNKITMEISQQLNGVTMQEPGVSRLVAVDIDEAAAMAVG